MTRLARAAPDVDLLIEYVYRTGHGTIFGGYAQLAAP